MGGNREGALGGRGWAPWWRTLFGGAGGKGKTEAEIRCPKRLVITAGPRLDYLLPVSNKARVALGMMQHFNVQLTNGDTQQGNRRAAYLHFAHDADYSGLVPNSINALAVRAKPGEGTRLRCLERCCPLRPEAERNVLAEGEDISVHAEMDVDDVEHLGVDEGMGDGEDDDQEPTIALPGGKRDLTVALWPFAFSKEYYKSIIEGVCVGERISHIVVLSTSAHPAYALAANDMRLTAHVHLDRVSRHSQAHGQLLLRNFIHQEFLVAEKALHSGGAKRVLAEDLAFVRVSAPAVEQQTLCFLEVPGDASNSAWRAGFNEFPPSDVLEPGIVALLQRELETCNLAVRPALAGGRHILVTEKARGDGDTICAISCLLFSDAAGLRECLNTAGNAALLAGPLVHVTGLRCPGGGEGGPGGEVMNVYGIPVGAARLVQDYQVAGRKQANARIRVRPSRGPNDGFLELTVSTHNGQGIAAGREILVDFGAARAYFQEPPTKRFKGALDAVLARQMAKASPHAAEGEATPTAAPAPALATTPVAARTAGAAPGTQEAKASAATASPSGSSAAPGAPTATTILFSEESVRAELQDSRVVIFSTKEKVTRIAPKTILTVIHIILYYILYKYMNDIILYY